MTPHLFDLQNKIDELCRNGYDIHTINLTINGQHGGWDVRIEATDDALNDHAWDLTMSVHGYDLAPALANA